MNCIFAVTGAEVVGTGVAQNVFFFNILWTSAIKYP